MKKNITINLCGRLYQIDEDAYEMLQHYIESLHSYFGKQMGDDEIADDIESRIAELFDELKAQGIEAINIEHVKDIITRIGKPEQMADSEKEEKTESSTLGKGLSGVRDYVAGKRLYRNPKDKMVAGVLSGFAAYTGTDPSIWRILTVVFTFFYGIGLVFYIILAILMPEAKTPEQQLQMEGKEVTPQNLADVVVDDQQDSSSHSVFRFIFSLFLKIVFGFFFFIALVICFALVVAMIGVLVACVSALLLPTSHFNIESFGIGDVYAQHPWLLWAFVVSLLALLFIPAYAIIHMILSRMGKTEPMGTGQRLIWVALWIIALCCAIPTGIMTGIYHSENMRLRWDAEHTYQGVVMNGRDANYMQQHGWLLVKHENCNGRYTNRGKYLTGNGSKAYLDVYNPEGSQVFQAERHEAVTAGFYSITCNARAQGSGVFIFAATPSSVKPLAQTMIPAFENEGGAIWEAARDSCYNDSVQGRLPRQNYLAIRNANDGKGWGWNPVEVLVAVEKDDSLFYGLTTDPVFTGVPHESEWFSACDFKLERITEEQFKERQQASLTFPAGNAGRPRPQN